MIRHIGVVVVFLLVIPLSKGFSQRIYAAKGIAKVRLEEHLSREETRDIARQQAQHTAIEILFGSYISKDAFVDVKDGNSEVTIKSASELKGEWLKTTKEEFREESRKIKDEYGSRNEIWIICEVEGKVREIVEPVIGFTFASLNCPDTRCETTDFENGESFYLKFKSPVDGYLSIYLVNSEQAFQVLPYQEMPSEYKNNVPVVADKEYIFFESNPTSKYFDGFAYYLTDELYLETDEKQEFYKIYVLFSQKPFAKPILDSTQEVEGEYAIPKLLRKRNFDVWVQDNRIFSTDFYYKTMNVRVRK